MWGESISLLNVGLKKRNVIIIVRDTVAQRNVERNGETIEPKNQAKINEQLNKETRPNNKLCG